MKSVLSISVIAAVVYVGSVHAGELVKSKLLMSKKTYSGHVAPGYRQKTQCEIYDDKVVQLVGAEDVSASTETKIKLKGDIAKAIEAAANGKIASETAPVDGPGKVYKAFKINPDQSKVEVVLLDDNGGNGVILRNESAEAMGLMNFIDMNCK